MEKALTEKGDLDDSKWDAFSEILHYRPVDYKDPGSFVNLSKSLRKLDQKHNTRGNRIFYLALEAKVSKLILNSLSFHNRFQSG